MLRLPCGLMVNWIRAGPSEKVFGRNEQAIPEFIEVIRVIMQAISVVAGQQSDENVLFQSR